MSKRPKPGSEYETFIYDAFRRFFPTLTVVKNDMILGNQSGLEREIDVSLRGMVGGTEVLYATQAKDYSRPADINVIGAFSAVLQDVGASKGFLVCAAGFTRKIKRYALSRGIELLTVEDIRSHKWKAEIQIPIALVLYDIGFTFHPTVLPTQQLIEQNRGKPLTINYAEVQASFDDGLTFSPLNDAITAYVRETPLELDKETHAKLSGAALWLKMADCVLPTEGGSIVLIPKPRRYLKYVSPSNISESRIIFEAYRYRLPSSLGN